jgi:hypothetical protein
LCFFAEGSTAQDDEKRIQADRDELLGRQKECERRVSIQQYISENIGERI